MIRPDLTVSAWVRALSICSRPVNWLPHDLVRMPVLDNALAGHGARQTPPGKRSLFIHYDCAEHC